MPERRPIPERIGGGRLRFGGAPNWRGAVSICGSAARARPATTAPRAIDGRSGHFRRSAQENAPSPPVPVRVDR